MRWVLVWLSCVAGCGGKESALGGDDFIDEPVPPKGCDATTGADTDCRDQLIPDGDCLATDDCMGGWCVAPFDGDIGRFVCRETCIELNDEASWCLDAAACCDPAATCSSRGYCEAAITATDTGIDSGGGVGTSTGATSGSSGTTGIGTSSDTDSGSGGT